MGHIVRLRDACAQGFYVVDEQVPPGHSYYRIDQFLADPDRIFGYEEQYAATAALIGRIADLPTRVVVGYEIPADRYVDGVADVRRNDITAWIEAAGRRRRLGARRRDARARCSNRRNSSSRPFPRRCRRRTISRRRRTAAPTRRRPRQRGARTRSPRGGRGRGRAGRPRFLGTVGGSVRRRRRSVRRRALMACSSPSSGYKACRHRRRAGRRRSRRTGSPARGTSSPTATTRPGVPIPERATPLETANAYLDHRTSRPACAPRCSVSSRRSIERRGTTTRRRPNRLTPTGVGIL